MAETVAQELEELERQLLQQEVRNNPKLVSALLADEFIEFGSSGRVWLRSEIIEALRYEQPRSVTLMRSFRVQQLAPDVVFVTYLAASQTDSLRSSIWVRRDGRWQMLFHQGTPTKLLG
jgi:hypothetical protein